MSRGQGKLRFTVLSCTGEDPDYPARELLYHSPQTRGWQCPRFCKFPQEITLQLEQPSKIEQIQILSHEYKIATKLEIYVGNLSPGSADPGRAQLRRLGHLSFDSNERSGHQARELKSVHVNTTASVFKLVVQRCHINKLNIYNQVGIVALNLLGEPLAEGRGAPTSSRTSHPTSRYPQSDLALDMGVDSKTAAVIRELHAKKEAAVANEDYDEAKQLKATIDRLRSVGQKIGQLEAKKAAAVEREDYDAAKQLKVDIDKLRRAAEADGSMKPSVPRRSNNPQEIFDRVLDVAGPPEGMNGGQHPMMGSQGGRYSEDGGLSPEQSPTGGSERGSYGYHPEDLPGPDGVPPPGGSRVLHSRDPNYGGGSFPPSYEAYDERPALGKGAYRLDSPSVQAQMENSPPIRAEPSHSKLPAGLKPPPGFPPDLPAPEPFSSADHTTAEPLVDLLGEYVVMCIYSKNWQLREAGMQAMEAQLSQGGLPKGDHRDEMRHLTKTIGKALKDKVANVFQSGMSNMRAMLDTYGAHVGSRDLVSTCSEFVTILMDKTGDNNSRTQSTAVEGLLHLAATPGMDQVIAHQVCKPAKSQSAWKPVLARLNLIQQLLPQFGVHTGKGGQGLPLEGVMAYIGAAFGSAKENVRSAAVKCTVMVYERVGDVMRPQLPTEMNKALREQLELELEEVDPGSAPRATGPSAASEAPPPKRAPSKKPKEAAQPPAPPQKAPPPEPAPAPAPPGAVDDSAVLDEDPAIYERELAQRESELGPEHPDVAESLSNLAILYNQQGHYDKAQPLYERALAIWERVQGPHSSDVAHTLTDLAVLHLEQGRDELGRPLLERALEIQRQNLGDDHPDVIAILEVLESDE